MIKINNCTCAWRNEVWSSGGINTLISNPCTRRRGWSAIEPSWNVRTHGDALEGKWRGNGRMEWVASTLHTSSKHSVTSITTADVHTSAASSRLNWCPRRFKWTRPFRRKTKSGFCGCVITFQKQFSTANMPALFTDSEIGPTPKSVWTEWGK